MAITHGARQLREWLTAQGQNQQWLASLLTEERGSKVSQSAVSGWLRGTQMPLWAALFFERRAGIRATAWLQPATEVEKVDPRHRVAS